MQLQIDVSSMKSTIFLEFLNNKIDSYDDDVINA